MHIPMQQCIVRRTEMFYEWQMLMLLKHTDTDVT